MHLIDYYNSHDEDARLLSRHGSVEHHTTMHYIHQYLRPGMQILEIGAGTGRYSLALAREGYAVHAVELMEHNLAILRNKIQPGDCITALQGNALNLSRYADETFDITLCLGPMYHLYTEDDRIQALREAARVTKKGGILLVAYCMNEPTVIQYCFQRGGIHLCLENNMLTEDFHCLSEPKDVFVLFRTEDIAHLNRQAPVEEIKLIASDGAANYMRATLDEMDERTFEIFLQYHLTTCERGDLIGASHHTLSILRRV